MINRTTVKHVKRSAGDTFSVIGTGVHTYHPQWEREVIENRPITPAPMGVGSRGVMVRREFGRTTETEYEVTAFEQDRRIAFHDIDDAMDFRISFLITPIDDGSCSVQVDVSAEPKGWTRVVEPLMRLAMPKRTERLANSMVEVIEGAPALA